MVVGYIGLTLLVPAGIAFLMSVLTDVPLGAVGAAVAMAVVAKPARLWRWGRRAFVVWRGWQSLRSSLLKKFAGGN